VCNGQHRTLRRSGSRFESGLGYFAVQLLSLTMVRTTASPWAHVDFVQPRTPARQAHLFGEGVAQAVQPGLIRRLLAPQHLEIPAPEHQSVTTPLQARDLREHFKRCQ